MNELPGLTSSIKSAFFDYVERMDDGVVEVSTGATRLEDGRFHFPFDRPLAAEEVVRFRGGVHVTGHFGMLAVSFIDPSIVRSGNDLYLTVADDDASEGRLQLLQLGTASLEETTALSFEAPTLTADGADLFFDNYRPGTPFAAIGIQTQSALGRLDLLDLFGLPNLVKGAS